MARPAKVAATFSCTDALAIVSPGLASVASRAAKFTPVPVNVSSVAPSNRGVDACAKVEMLIFRDAGIQRMNQSVHLPSGLYSAGHRFETRHETIAKVLHHDAVKAREYYFINFADEVGPSVNGPSLLLSHEPNRFDEVDEQHDGLSLDKSNVHTPSGQKLGFRGLLFFVHGITVDIE